MTTITQIVQSLSSKPVNTKFGLKDTYSFKGEDGQWYKMGFDKPKFGAGAEIQYDYEEGTYGKEVKKGSVVVINVTAPVGAISKGPAVGTKVYTAKAEKEWVFPIPPRDWQRNVIRQEAVKCAINYLQSMTGAKTALQVIQVIEVAKQFEHYMAGDNDMETAMAAVKAMDKTPDA